MTMGQSQLTQWIQLRVEDRSLQWQRGQEGLQRALKPRDMPAEVALPTTEGQATPSLDPISEQVPVAVGGGGLVSVSATSSAPLAMVARNRFLRCMDRVKSYAEKNKPSSSMGCIPRRCT
jgi:hypothetical protein